MNNSQQTSPTNALHPLNSSSPTDSYSPAHSASVGLQRSSSRENIASRDYYSSVGASVDTVPGYDRVSRDNRRGLRVQERTVTAGYSYDRDLHSSDYNTLDQEYSNPTSKSEFPTAMDNPEYSTAAYNSEYSNPSSDNQDGAVYAEPTVEEGDSKVIMISAWS